MEQPETRLEPDPGLRDATTPGAPRLETVIPAWRTGGPITTGRAASSSSSFRLAGGSQEADQVVVRLLAERIGSDRPPRPVEGARKIARLLQKGDQFPQRLKEALREPLSLRQDPLLEIAGQQFTRYSSVASVRCAARSVRLFARAAAWSAASKARTSVAQAAGFNWTESRSATRTALAGRPGGSNWRRSEVSSRLRLLRPDCGSAYAHLLRWAVQHHQVVEAVRPKALIQGHDDLMGSRLGVTRSGDVERFAVVAKREAGRAGAGIDVAEDEPADLIIGMRLEAQIPGVGLRVLDQLASAIRGRLLESCVTPEIPHHGLVALFGHHLHPGVFNTQTVNVDKEDRDRDAALSDPPAEYHVADPHLEELPRDQALVDGRGRQ